MSGFQIIVNNHGTVFAVFTSSMEYRKMLWLFPPKDYRAFNHNGYPAVRLHAWSKSSVRDAIVHG